MSHLLEDSSSNDSVIFDEPTDDQMQRFHNLTRDIQAPSPEPGPSGLQNPSVENSPEPGPSGLQNINWRTDRNHQRQRVEFRNIRQRNQSRSPSPTYTHSILQENQNAEEIHLHNNSFTVRFFQDEFRQNHRWRISDHLYTMEFEPNNENHIYLLRDLFRLIDEALTRVITELQIMYPNTYHHQIYVTVLQRNILNGLNSGNYSMATPVRQIVNHILNLLENYLQSNERVQLDESFKIQFRVFSVEHTLHRIQNDPQFMPHIYRPGNSNEQKYPTYILSISDYCVTHKKKCFSNMCLLISSMLGILMNDNAKKIEIIKILLSPQKDTYLHNNLDMFCKTHRFLQKDQVPDANSILEPLTKEHKVQFHLFDADLQYSFIESFPKCFDFRRRPIYICLFRNMTHATLITNYEDFCLKNKKFYCFLCTKYFRHKKDFQHFCKAFKFCFVCCRPFAKEDYFDHDTNKFCDKLICKSFEVELKHCIKCNQTCQTTSCFEAHKRICGRGVRFDCCNKFNYKSNELTSLSLLKENHICSEIKCIHCKAHLRESLDKSHQCKISPYIPKSEYPTLCFLHMAFENNSGVNCKKCSEKKCEIHSRLRSELIPVQAILSVPLSTNEFICHWFYEYKTTYKSQNITVLQNQIYNEPPKELKTEPPFTELKKRSRTSLIDHLLFFIITQKIFDRVFICFDPSGSIMMTLIKMLTSNGIAPKIEHTQNVPILLKVPDLKIRILNVINFLPFQSIQEICPMQYFPFTVLKAENCDKIVSLTPDDFLLRDDSFEVIKEKKESVCKMDLTNYNMEQNLSDFLINFVKSLVKETLNFVTEMKIFQEEACKYYKVPFQFLHPLNESISKNGFFFRLYRFLELNNHEVFAIPNEYTGIYGKTSKSELEYVQFLTFSHPNLTFEHHYSKYGQTRRLLSAIPDAFCNENGFSYFYNGCYHHK